MLVSELIIESFFERLDNAPRNVIKGFCLSGLLSVTTIINTRSEAVEKRKKHRRFVEMISHLARIRPLSQRTYAVLMINEEKVRILLSINSAY